MWFVLNDLLTTVGNRYRHWGSAAPRGPPSPTSAVEAHFTESIALLQALVENKRASIAKGVCPHCGVGRRAPSDHPAERLRQLEHLQRTMMLQAGTRVELPPLAQSPVAMVDHSLPEPVSATHALQSPSQGNMEAHTIEPTGKSLPADPPVETTVETTSVEQGTAEAAASILLRLIPRTSTPRSFVVYAPAALPGQRTMTTDDSASKLTKGLALDAPDAVSSSCGCSNIVAYDVVRCA